MNIARERSSREYIAKNGEKEFLVVFNAYYYKPACICLKYEKIVHNAHHSVLLSPAGKISWYSTSFLASKKLPDHLLSFPCNVHSYRPHSIYQYFQVFFVLIPKRDSDTKKTTPNIEV